MYVCIFVWECVQVCITLHGDTVPDPLHYDVIEVQKSEPVAGGGAGRGEAMLGLECG